MRQTWSERLKQSVRPLWFRLFAGGRPAFACPICGYTGPFKDKRISREPDLVRVNSKCLGCGANERHRMQLLVFEEVFGAGKMRNASALHLAPEDCLRPVIKKHFATYHTADLFKTDVDFKEDIQKLSLADASYDAVIVSRVLTIPPDLTACIREMRRVLKPGGIAIIAEIYQHERTQEFGRMVNHRSRELGLDAFDLYAKHFGSVERFYSDRYDAKYQLHNLMVLDGQPKDAYPEGVKLADRGFKDLVAVCHV
jgi:SAM-dependent methyltransferase